MRWLTNIYDPSRPDAHRHLFVDRDETPEDAMKYRRQWLADKAIGDPQPTRAYSVAELKEMDMVGVYAKEESEAA
jgi:hypothetical protein